MHGQERITEATIYNYRLIRRLHYAKLYLLPYAGLAVLYLGLAVWFGSAAAGLSALIGFAFVLLIHMLFIRLYLIIKTEKASAWAMQWRFPWIGYLPQNYISIALMNQIQWQVLWIGLAFICCFYPWISPVSFASLLFFHLWVLLPRFVIFFRLAKVKKTGYLKVNEKDTSLYSQ